MNAKQTALDAYLQCYAAIRSKIEALQQHADDHFGHNPDAIHWGHVGDLGRVEAGGGRVAGDLRPRRVTTRTKNRRSP